MTAADPLEQRLLDGYAEQLAHYDGALAILRKATSETAHDGSWVQDLHAILVRLGAMDVLLGPDRLAWRQAPRAPGGELRAMCEHIAARIEALAQGVHGHIRELMTRQSDLLPALDILIQKRRMREAYGKHGGI